MEQKSRTGRVGIASRTSSILRLLPMVGVLVALAGCREANEIPYSVFKAHVTAGEVVEVRFSPGRLEAVPTVAARAAGAPEIWSTQPVASDAGLVPLLDAQHVQYRSKDDSYQGT